MKSTGRGSNASRPVGKGHPFARLRMTPIATPQFASEEEEATWWDTHKKEADAFVERAYRKGAMTRGTIGGAKGTKQTTLRLLTEDIGRAKRVAERKGLPYQTYLKMLIHEGLGREERTHGS